MTDELCSLRKGVRYLPHMFIVLLMPVSLSWSVGKAQIIVDHNCTDISKIPDYWIEEVKGRNMLVQYVGESHSRQMLFGLQILETQDSKYSVQINENLNNLYEPNALRVLNGKYTPYGWSAYAGDQDYWSIEQGRLITEDTAQQAINQGDPINVSLWCWCWEICRPASFFSQANDFNDTHIQWYLDAIERFNNNASINQAVFIYHTSVSDCSDYYNPDGPWRVTHYNQVIRLAAMANDTLLFDQADIENWNISNTEQYIVIDGQGRTVYPRHPDYSESNPPDTYTGDHANDALCIRKAKALWWMMARITGWDGRVPKIGGDINGDCKVDLGDLGIMSSQWLNDNCGDANWCEEADLNQNGTVDFTDFATLSARWLDDFTVEGDISGDCKVDLFDLAIFSDAWFAESGSPNWNDLCDLAPSGGDGVVNFRDLAVLCDEWLVGIDILAL